MNYLHLTPSFVFTHLFKHENCESWFKFHFKWWKIEFGTVSDSSKQLATAVTHWMMARVGSRLQRHRQYRVLLASRHGAGEPRGWWWLAMGNCWDVFFLWEIWDHKTENTWNKNNNEITYIDIYIYIYLHIYIYIYIYNNIISWDFEGWITLISPMKSFKIWASEQGIKVGAESVSER